LSPENLLEHANGLPRGGERGRRKDGETMGGGELGEKRVEKEGVGGRVEKKKTIKIAERSFKKGVYACGRGKGKKGGM